MPSTHPRVGPHLNLLWRPHGIAAIIGGTVLVAHFNLLE
jgi:hypothetical protein